MKSPIISFKYFVAALLIFMVSAKVYAQQDVVISEFSASNDKVIFDEDGDASDWIEIYNHGIDAVQLKGWSLTDDASEPKKWSFPESVLDVGDFLIIFASGKDQSNSGNEMHTGFKLSAGGEYLGLYDENGINIFEYSPSYPEQYGDVSYGIKMETNTTNLVSKESVGTYYLPSGEAGTLPLDWTGGNEPFDVSQWTSCQQSLGFEARQTNDADINIALGKTATQSSGYGNDQFPASIATDNILNNFTHTAIGDLEPWLEIDLEKGYTLSRIEMYNRTGCCQHRLFNISVEIFDDKNISIFESELLNPYAEGESPEDPGEKIVFDFTTADVGLVTGQKIRIKKTTIENQDEFLSLAEVQVYGTETYENEILTDLAAMQDRSSLIQVRFPFEFNDVTEVDQLQLKVNYDDGFVAYLNGHEVASSNRPESELNYNTVASDVHFAGEFQDFIIPIENLNEGTNILALVGLNNSISDPSFLIQPLLYAHQIELGEVAFFPSPTPGKINNEGFNGFVEDTKFDIDRGFFDEAFSLTITSETPGASIIYTLDGSEPGLENGIVVLPDNVNSTVAAVVEITTTTVIRAAAFKDGLYNTNTDTHSYIFRDDVVKSDVMNTDIIEDPRYNPYMRQALSDIPSISLVVPPGDIEKTDDKKASIEFLMSDNEAGFQEECGARYYGGEWAGPFQKQNFRIYFRSVYGASKLKYPLFEGFENGISSVEIFDQLELRAGSHDMVQRGFYMSNRFADDTMLEMGNLNTHGRFVHLYFNGEYRGMYHLRERFNADWLANYTGGEKDDYEAISGNKNIGGWTLNDRVYDGEGIAWEEAKSLRNDYEQVKEYIDLNAYIDFMLLYMFGNSENEYRCAANSVPGVKFQFQLNDADGFLRDTGNRTNMGQPGQEHADGPGSIFSMLFNEGHPAYKILLADRIHKHFFNNGALTPDKIAIRLGDRCDEVEIPFYAEAARWGYRTPSSWSDAKDDYFENVIPFRTETVIQHFKDAGFYPDLDAPVFLINDSISYGGYFKEEAMLSISSENEATYYTLDGSDPYIPGNQVSETKQILGEDASLTAFVLTESIPDAWSNVGFDDSSWKHGSKGVGYETQEGYEDEIGLDVSEMYENYNGCLIRIPFDFHDNITMENYKLILKMKFDDGFIAYLNGEEIKRSNFAGDPEWNSAALNAGEASGFIEYDISMHIDKLIQGGNVLAIHGLNSSTSSSDFLISAQLEFMEIIDVNAVINDDAVMYNTPILLDTTVVISARSYKDGIWSALSKATFSPETASSIFDPNETNFLEVISSPNPFTNEVSISISAKLNSPFDIEVYNNIGQKIWARTSSIQSGEMKKFDINASMWNPGLYFYKVKISDNEIYTGKMIHAK